VQLLKNYQTFYGTRRFVTTFTRAFRRFLSSEKSIHFHTTPLCLSKIHLNIMPTYVLVFLVVSFALALTPITYRRCSSIPLVFYALPIRLPCLELYLARRTSYEVPHYAAFSIMRLTCAKGTPNSMKILYISSFLSKI
jgi:hypothetical protein